jgi:hypothetical protein
VIVRRVLRTFAVSALLAFTFACGIKSPPRAPSDRVRTATVSAHSTP